ncbi:sensor histidine kinase [Gephyromycinifex aptenodytis]|uniref:sensor histidine kinase n=1 Tax=Gephyromycinifex aptenodytis TaxID=2716227 RepID=UPI001D01B436|nr:ATP-binding protein [Gephyromycinifex aptenodytis]
MSVPAAFDSSEDGCDAGEIFQAMPDGVLVADADGRVVAVNPRAARLMGRAAQDIRGEHITQALPLLDASGHSWWECVDPWDGLAIRTGHRERMLLLPGRGQVLVTMSFTRQRRSGPVTRIIVALRDTDARRRAEAANAELISLVAHELRSPLTSVKGFSTTLLRRWDRFNDDQKHLMIETIEADAGRLARLIHELLDVSRLDTSRLRLDPTRIDLVSVIDAQVARFVAAGLDRARFDWSAPPEPIWVRADPDRLDQVFTNLLENAIRHGAGTVSLSVQLLTGCDVPRAQVAIADEGEGIRPEHYPLVFTKFWHGSRRGSTGLGLYLVKGLIEAHRGSICVDRAPGGGALFRFTLPLIPSEVGPAGAVESA